MLDFFISYSDISSIKRMSIRQLLIQFVNASYAVIGSYMIWKFIGVLLNNDSPIVVVLSESMEPGFKRGDILILKRKEFAVGDISVFQIYKNEIPIVHRVIKKFGENRTLTKGDNNRGDDVLLYGRGKYFLNKDEVISTVIGYIPFFGMITIWINEIPHLKFIIMFFVSMSVFLTREA